MLIDTLRIGEETNHILKDINISIDTGEFIAIMGHSGSGKKYID